VGSYHDNDRLTHGWVEHVHHVPQEFTRLIVQRLSREGAVSFCPVSLTHSIFDRKPDIANCASYAHYMMLLCTMLVPTGHNSTWAV